MDTFHSIFFVMIAEAKQQNTMEQELSYITGLP